VTQLSDAVVVRTQTATPTIVRRAARVQDSVNHNATDASLNSSRFARIRPGTPSGTSSYSAEKCSTGESASRRIIISDLNTEPASRPGIRARLHRSSSLPPK